MPTFDTLQKLITEKWELFAALAVLLGATGLLGGFVKWRQTQRQRRRQRQIPSGDFPFDVIQPNSQDVVKRLMPPQGVEDSDPLADFNIPYLERRGGRSVRQELGAAFTERSWVVILGRTGLGKTREAAHLAELLNREGWTVLKLAEQASEWLDEPRQFPTDKISPHAKLLFLLDDLNRWLYRGNPREIYKAADDPTQPLRVPVTERLLRTLEFYERECRAEVRVIATARNEATSDANRPDQPSELAKLQFEQYPKFWERFYRYDLTEPEVEVVTHLLEDRVAATNIRAETTQLPQIARRNDGMFRNIVENLRTIRNRNLVLNLDTASETLDRTWHQRYKAAVKRHPASVYVYQAIALLRSLNLYLHPALVQQTAQLFIQRNGLGWLWQTMQIRRAFHHLVQAEQILQPRDGQIEASGATIDAVKYAPSILNLLIYLGKKYYPARFLAEELFYCGDALDDLNCQELAISSYEQAIAHKPDMHEAWYNLGIALGRLERYEAAITCYNRVIQIRPTDHEAWYNKGGTLGKLKRYEEAITCYNRVTQIKPSDHEAWYNKACYSTLWNKPEAAMESLRQAVELNPEYRKMAKTDSDFDSIRQDDRFRALIEEAHGESGVG